MGKYANGEPVPAGSYNRHIESQKGTGVVQGLEVSHSSGMDVEIATGTLSFQHDEYEIHRPRTETIAENTCGNPRKDFVYAELVDGSVNITSPTGTPHPYVPSLEDVEDWTKTAKPRPPSLKNLDDVVVLG